VLPTRRWKNSWKFLSLESFSHFFNKQYVGLDFATELSEMLYSTTAFESVHQDDLSTFLAADFFGTLCVPAKAVRSLEVRFRMELFHPATGLVSFFKPEPTKQDYSAAVARSSQH